jgi:hypothetical protein
MLEGLNLETAVALLGLKEVILKKTLSNEQRSTSYLN